MSRSGQGLRRFTSRDLQRRLGEVQEAALRDAVLITFHGRGRLVVMAADAYAKLSGRPLATSEHGSAAPVEPSTEGATGD